MFKEAVLGNSSPENQFRSLSGSRAEVRSNLLFPARNLHVGAYNGGFLSFSPHELRICQSSVGQCILKTEIDFFGMLLTSKHYMIFSMGSTLELLANLLRCS